MISESIKTRPDAHVTRWLAEVDEDRAFLSAATVTESRFGVERMPRGRRREHLAAWLDHELVERFEGRLLGVDRFVADAWGVAMAQSQRSGVGIGVMDALLAATAQAHRLTLATRNVRHFVVLDVPPLDPWDGPSAS